MFISFLYVIVTLYNGVYGVLSPKKIENNQQCEVNIDNNEVEKLECPSSTVENILTDTFRYVDWCFYVSVSSNFDLSKLSIVDLQNNPIKEIIKLEKTLFCRKVGDKLFEKINLLLKIDLVKWDGKLKLSYSGENCLIKTFKIIKNEIEDLSRYCDCCSEGDFANVDSISGHKVDTAYCLEIVRDDTNKVLTDEEKSIIVVLEDRIKQNLKKVTENEENNRGKEEVVDFCYSESCQTKNIFWEDNKKNSQRTYTTESDKFYDANNPENLKQNQNLRDSFEHCGEQNSDLVIKKENLRRVKKGVLIILDKKPNNKGVEDTNSIKKTFSDVVKKTNTDNSKPEKEARSKILLIRPIRLYKEKQSDY